MNNELNRRILRNTVIAEMALYPVGSLMNQLTTGNRTQEEINEFVINRVMPYLEATAATLQLFYSMAEATNMPTPIELGQALVDLRDTTYEEGEVLIGKLVDKCMTPMTEDNLTKILSNFINTKDFSTIQ